MQCVNQFTLNSWQFNVRTVSALNREGSLPSPLLQKRRYTTGKNYNIGIFHTSYRCIDIYLLLEADIEIQLRIASEILKVKFDVVKEHPLLPVAYSPVICHHVYCGNALLLRH